jgi:hypothetical protein
MNSAVTNGQTMIRRFLCDFHPITMAPFMRELEARPREEVMKYSIPSDFFPFSIGAVPSSSAAIMAMSATPIVEASAVPIASTGTMAKTSYVPPHMRKAGGAVSAVPEHHVAAAPAPAPAAATAYVPPHMRRKTAGPEPVTMTKLNASGKKKEDEFPTLGGAGGASKGKKSAWSKDTSFATVAAAPAPTDAPELETQATILIRENERLRQMMIAQTRQRDIAKFDAMAVRENGGVAFGGGESDDEHGGRGGSDDEGVYDDEDAENDKYYA